MVRLNLNVDEHARSEKYKVRRISGRNELMHVRKEKKRKIRGIAEFRKRVSNPSRVSASCSFGK